MDFTLDETQEDLRRLARSIFDERVTLPRLREVEESEEGIDRDLWAELAKADLLGVALPEEVGGSGHGIMELCVLLEEVGRRVAPIPLYSTIGLGALTIASWDGESWRLDGTKVAVPHGTLADRILVSARTSARATALFALDPAAPG